MSLAIPLHTLGYTSPQTIPRGDLSEQGVSITKTFQPIPEVNFVGDQVKQIEMLTEYTPINYTEGWRFLMFMSISKAANGWFGIEAANGNGYMNWNNGTYGFTGASFTTSKNEKHTFVLNNEGLKVDNTLYPHKATTVY